MIYRILIMVQSYFGRRKYMAIAVHYNNRDKNLQTGNTSKN